MGRVDPRRCMPEKHFFRCRPMDHGNDAVTAYLGLGSNLGDRLAILQAFRQRLANWPGVAVVRASSLYESEPLGGPEGQGWYLNAVLEVRSSVVAEQLLAVGLELENQFGRKRELHHGPRTLDVDLLLYADRVCHQTDLILPHPRLHQRSFVLNPLCELAPDLVHPLLGKTARQLRDSLSGNQGIRRLAISW